MEEAWSEMLMLCGCSRWVTVQLTKTNYVVCTYGEFLFFMSSELQPALNWSCHFTLGVAVLRYIHDEMLPACVNQCVSCIPALSWMLILSGIAHMLQKKLYKSLSTGTYIFLMNVQVNWHHVWRFCSLWIKHCVYMLHVVVMVTYAYITLLAYLYFTHKPETV